MHCCLTDSRSLHIHLCIHAYKNWCLADLRSFALLIGSSCAAISPDLATFALLSDLATFALLSKSLLRSVLLLPVPHLTILLPHHLSRY